ncbi:hypothetical protein B0H15DRAFT_861492 [Mycena belliarum]|uniref:C2H2-type domain-containing protein n=1 Tax=Mycena belliarum TaxID=1033014 RepID=A0AAD6XL33_9AGAR|nr:hypothetical protein B0H15DRAFT_861492 [Mycena belliae]
MDSSTISHSQLALYPDCSLSYEARMWHIDYLAERALEAEQTGQELDAGENAEQISRFDSDYLWLDGGWVDSQAAAERFHAMETNPTSAPAKEEELEGLSSWIDGADSAHRAPAICSRVPALRSCRAEDTLDPPFLSVQKSTGSCARGSARSYPDPAYPVSTLDGRSSFDVYSDAFEPIICKGYMAGGDSFKDISETFLPFEETDSSSHTPGNIILPTAEDCSLSYADNAYQASSHEVFCKPAAFVSELSEAPSGNSTRPDSCALYSDDVSRIRLPSQTAAPEPCADSPPISAPIRELKLPLRRAPTKCQPNTAGSASSRSPSPQPPGRLPKGAYIERGQVYCGLADCAHQCRSVADLWRHRESLPHSAKRHRCPGCPSAFTRADALTRHLGTSPRCRDARMAALRDAFLETAVAKAAKERGVPGKMLKTMFRNFVVGKTRGPRG